MEERRTGADRRAAPRGPDRRKPGRPTRVEGEAASERIWSFLTPTERAELQRVADDTGQRVAELVRDAINEYVADFSERRVCTTVNSDPLVT
jgi:TRAP-type C4-dicarboxylate transport system substrate-binding protein